MPEKPRVFATLDVDPAPDPEAGLGHSVVPHVQEARVACLRFAPLGSGKLTKAIQGGQLLMPKKHVRISPLPSGTTLAEGPVGWDITPFEANYFISRKYLQTRGFKQGRGRLKAPMPYLGHSSNRSCFTEENSNVYLLKTILRKR